MEVLNSIRCVLQVTWGFPSSFVSFIAFPMNKVLEFSSNQFRVDDFFYFVFGFLVNKNRGRRMRVLLRIKLRGLVRRE